jgi:hypothetical protein
MYVEPNFKTKKALKEAVKAGDQVTVFSPGPFPAATEGRVSIEGPHYPGLILGTPASRSAAGGSSESSPSSHRAGPCHRPRSGSGKFVVN